MRSVELGKLTAIQTGKIDVNKAVPSGRYPFFTCSRETYQINDAPFEGKAVLVAGNGDLNVKYYEGKFNAYQRTYFLFANREDELLPRYLYWFLESYIDQLRSQSSGSTIRYIKRGHLADARIPLPPLEAQRSIVEKLDSNFGEIEMLEKNLAKIDEKYKQLLHSLLCTSLSPVEVQSVSLDSSTIQENAPSSKEFVEFRKVFTVIPDSHSKIKSSLYLASGDYAVVDQGKELVAGYTNSVATVTEESLPVIVFGDHTRAVKYVDFPFVAGADGTQILKPTEQINPKFGYYLLLNAVSKIPPKGYARHFGELKKVSFLVPSLERQVEIIKKLDCAFTAIDTLIEQVKKQKRITAALRRSMLNSFFAQVEASV